MFSIIEKMNFEYKSIILRLNSSRIFDKLIDKIFDKKKISNETKIEFLLLLSEISNENCKNNKNNKFEFLKEKFNIKNKKLKELKEFFNINCSIDSIKKNFFITKEIYNEVIKIKEIFNSDFIDIKRKKEQIKIDFSFIPNNLIFFNGFYCQIYYNENGNKIPLIEGGNIDNYLNNNENYFVHGFSFITYIENFLTINNNEIKFFDETICDFLIINLFEAENENEKKEKQKKINKLINLIENEKMTFEIIFKPQKQFEFNFYFKIYRMKCLIILIKKKNIEFEVRIKDNIYPFSNITNLNIITKIINNKWKKKEKKKNI
jgi:hypothetical protein